MIEICRVGDIFGEVAVIDGSTRTADAVAEGRIRLLRINGRVFLDVLHTNPVLGAISAAYLPPDCAGRSHCFRMRRSKAWKFGLHVKFFTSLSERADPRNKAFSWQGGSGKTT